MEQERQLPTIIRNLFRFPQNALEASPISEVLIEESIIGWKEFELEIMRDKAGNFLVVCSIENFDPVGVHTGDSIDCCSCTDTYR